jgi:iron complex outermembrane receptor protein
MPHRRCRTFRRTRGAQTPLDWSNRDGARFGATWATRLGAAEVNLGADWRDKQQRSYFDQSGFPTFRDDRLDYSALTPRMRLPAALAGLRHNLTLGADWIRWRYDSRRSDRPGNVGQPINRVRIDRETQALYLQDRIELSAASLATLGWREERVTYQATDAYDPAAGFGSEAPAAAARQRENAWELGLRHAVTDSWVLFTRAGRSFRFDGADEHYENEAAFAAQFQIRRPQTARTHEAGAEWRSPAVRLRGTLFQSDATDEIHLDPFTFGVGNTNLPPSRRRGVELDGAWRPTSALQLTSGYAYTDARFRSGVLPGNAFFGTDVSIAGKRVPLVPAHKLNLGVAWDLDARTRLSGALTAVSSQFVDNDEPNSLGVKIPAYAVVDLKLAHELGWGRVALAVNNLLDEQYYTYAVRSQFTADRYAVYPLPGRTLSFTVELRVD